MKKVLLRAMTAVVAVGSALALAPGLATAATPPELDFAAYPAVDANRYVSYNYDNNGRAFFRAGEFYCSIGSRPGASLPGRPATARPECRASCSTTTGARGGSRPRDWPH